MGTDERKKNCEVSQLPQKTAYGFYGCMMLLITIYWVFMSSNLPESIGAESERIHEEKDFEKDDYKRNHANNNSAHSSEVKKITFENIYNVEDEQVGEICQTVREAEEEVHQDARDTYSCILKNYGGDHPTTSRLKDPSGGMLLKGKKLVNKKLDSRNRWLGCNISSMFVMLCLHNFDYIKDIGTKSKSSLKPHKSSQDHAKPLKMKY